MSKRISYKAKVLKEHPLAICKLQLVGRESTFIIALDPQHSQTVYVRAPNVPLAWRFAYQKLAKQ